MKGFLSRFFLFIYYDGGKGRFYWKKYFFTLIRRMGFFAFPVAREAGLSLCLLAMGFFTFFRFLELLLM